MTRLEKLAGDRVESSEVVGEKWNVAHALHDRSSQQ